jgi:Cu+-exporting ATPase
VEAAEAIDPICGMTVTIAGARHHAPHEGREFYFCNARCKDKFLAEPARYLSAQAS